MLSEVSSFEPPDPPSDEDDSPDDEDDWEDDDEDDEEDWGGDEVTELDAFAADEDAAEEAADEAAVLAAAATDWVTVVATVCVTTVVDGHGVANIELTHLSTSPLANCEYVKTLEVPLIITNTPDVD